MDRTALRGDDRGVAIEIETNQLNRRGLAAAVERLYETKERLVLVKNGVRRAALVTLEDLARLERETGQIVNRDRTALVELFLAGGAPGRTRR